jgi:hypothetical protein
MSDTPPDPTPPPELPGLPPLTPQPTPAAPGLAIRPAEIPTIAPPGPEMPRPVAMRA